MRDPRYDVLFEPVQLGPVTARNRFFQVPHCNGMGHHHPTAHAHMRGVKAEGGWAVVCTEEVEIHPSSEVSPYIEGRLWDDADIPALARMTEKIHEHGSLAGIEPCHNGIHSANMYSRETGMAVGHLPVGNYDPVQVAADGRGRHPGPAPLAPGGGRGASLEAGFDVVYVYAAHGLNIDRAVPVAQVQPPHRRLRRQPREPRPAPARDARGHPRRGRRARGGRLPDHGRRAGRRRRDRPARHRGRARPRRRAARRVGLRRRRVGERLVDVAVRAGGVARAVRPRPEGAHLQARRRRRPVHVARHDGADGARRRARHDRRRPAVDRRPVPAEEDRGGPARGHPGVHRLQHLRLGRRHDQPDPVHPEPVDGRGVAARMAPGADAAQDVRRVRARRRRGPGRARGGDVARPPRPPRRPGRGDPGARRPGRTRGAPARAWPSGSGSSTTAAASSSACPTSRSPTTAA